MFKNNLAKALIASVFFFAFVSFNAYSEENTKEVKIQTNAHCGSCKSKIENGLTKLDGVLKSSVSMDDKVVTVAYNPSKTTEEKITKQISNLGYTTNVKSAADSDCCYTKDAKKVKSTSSKKECGSESKCCSSKTGTVKTTEVSNPEVK